MPGHDAFVCGKCGKCCRHIDTVPELRELDSGNGVCVHLVNNLCEIYEGRPDVCNVERMYELVFSQLLSREQYYALSAQACRNLQDLRDAAASTNTVCMKARPFD